MKLADEGVAALVQWAQGEADLLARGDDLLDLQLRGIDLLGRAVLVADDQRNGRSRRNMDFRRAELMILEGEPDGGRIGRAGERACAEGRHHEGGEGEAGYQAVGGHSGRFLSQRIL